MNFTRGALRVMLSIDFTIRTENTIRKFNVLQNLISQIVIIIYDVEGHPKCDFSHRLLSPQWKRINYRLCSYPLFGLSKHSISVDECQFLYFLIEEFIPFRMHFHVRRHFADYYSARIFMKVKENYGLLMEGYI